MLAGLFTTLGEFVVANFPGFGVFWNPRFSLKDRMLFDALYSTTRTIALLRLYYSQPVVCSAIGFARSRWPRVSPLMTMTPERGRRDPNDPAAPAVPWCIRHKSAKLCSYGLFVLTSEQFLVPINVASPPLPSLKK